jgi:hypothetical protein
MENLIIIGFLVFFGTYQLYMIRRDFIGGKVYRSLKKEKAFVVSADTNELTDLLNGISLGKLYFLSRRLMKEGSPITLMNMYRVAIFIMICEKRRWLFRPTFYKF